MPTDWPGFFAALPNDLVATRDRALLLVGFFCALRRSRARGAWRSRIWIDGQTAGSFHPSGAKPTPTAEAITLAAGYTGPLCPTAALADWLAIAAITEGPVFRTVGPDHKIASALRAPQVGMIFGKQLSEAGLAAQRLSAHSLRSGFAVSATRAGIAASPNPGCYPPSVA